MASGTRPTRLDTVEPLTPRLVRLSAGHGKPTF